MGGFARKPKEPEPTTPDRVSYSADRKISDDNYGGWGFHASFSTEVRPGETPEEALERARLVVEPMMKRQSKKGYNHKVGY